MIQWEGKGGSEFLVGSAGFKPVRGVTRVILGGFDSHILPPFNYSGDVCLERERLLFLW